MMTAWRRAIGIVLVALAVAECSVFALPGFSDRNVSQGNLNPTDRVLVQEVRIAGDSGHDASVTSVTVRNLGTATSGDIDRIEFWNGAEKLGEEEILTGLKTGITVNLGGFVIGAGTSRSIKVYVVVGTGAEGGETVQLSETFHYVMNGRTYSSPAITDLTGETIRYGGFDSVTETEIAARYLNPSDEAIVLIGVFRDEDANGNNVEWSGDGSTTIVELENIGTATTADIAEVKVTLTIGATEYVTWDGDEWLPWTDPIMIPYDAFRPDPPRIDDNGSVALTVKVRMKGSLTFTDNATLRMKGTLYVQEGREGDEQEYQQSVASSTTQTLRRQGFESISDESEPVASHVKTRGEILEQVIALKDLDVNNDDVELRAVSLQNLGSATGAEISRIEVREGARTLLSIVQPDSRLAAFKSGITVDLATPRTVDDDTGIILKVYYYIGTPSDGDTLRPVVRVVAREHGTDYLSDSATYPEEISLYMPGLEEVINQSPPEGGTAYSGQRFLAQVIRLVDRDEDSNDVKIHPVVVRNMGTAEGGTDVIKIEVRRQDSPGGEEVLLGETTSLAGLRTGGAEIEILSNNTLRDATPFAEMYVLIYVTLAEPEVMHGGHTLQLDTRILHTENQRAYDKGVVGNPWTLEINHRPTVEISHSPEVANIGEEIEFTATANDADGDEIVSYEWDFGERGAEPAEGATATHAYRSGGTFTVSLTVTDEKGLTATAEETVVVNRSPVVDFEWSPLVPDLEEVVTFTPTVDDPDNPDDLPYSYRWDFGDASEVSTEMSPEHSFSERKTYDVTLEVTDARGGITSVTKELTVGNFPPEVDFTWTPSAPDVGESVAFTAVVTDPDDPDDTPYSYKWDFGDGSFSSVASPTHVFNAKKVYTVTLVVTDSRGGRTTVEKDISIGNELPVASFTAAPLSPGIGEEVSFLDASSDADGTIVRWSWDFGDGRTSSERNPKHSYVMPGTYQVSLVVTDDRGGESSPALLEITVTGPVELFIQIYPNPASTEATIAYALPDGATDPVLRIYDISGRLVRGEDLAAGETTYLWNLRDDAGDPLPNGLYFCIVSAKNAAGRTVRSDVFRLLIAR